jgi:FkbM family methyltransferase
MKTLIYIGAHQGNSLENYVNYYDIVYAFEANPNFCRILQQRFINNNNVKIINAAICEKHNTFVDFNISSNNGDSSSLLEANKSNELYNTILPKEKIKIPAINLFNFCEENDISYIDTYISDLQGYDFIVLKTLEKYINDGLIGEIQCEVEKNDKITIYVNEDVKLQNKEKNFDDLLNKKYEKIAKGWGFLEDNKFQDVPDNWCEQDIKWKLKKL